MLTLLRQRNFALLWFAGLYLAYRRLDVDDRIAYLCVYPDAFGAGNEPHVYRGNTTTNCAWLCGWCFRRSVGSQASDDYYQRIACSVSVALALIPLGKLAMGCL